MKKGDVIHPPGSVSAYDGDDLATQLRKGRLFQH